MAAFADWPDERLDAFLCHAYREAGRDAEAVALAWRRFEGGTTLATYRFLADVARDLGILDAQRTRAIDHRARAADAEACASGGPGSPAVSRSLLVEVLLHEGRVDEAWAEATTCGVSEGTWLHLAGARAESHPADAIPIYQREVQATLRFADKRAYADAVVTLRRVRDLYARADRPARSTRATHRPCASTAATSAGPANAPTADRHAVSCLAAGSLAHSHLTRTRE